MDFEVILMGSAVDSLTLLINSLKSNRMGYCGKKSKSNLNRRDFLKNAVSASLFAPWLIKSPHPILEPIFRKEKTPKPSIETPEETWNDGFSAVFDFLEKNIQSRSALIWSHWAKPSPRLLATYLWDVCFSSQTWNLWKPAIAWEILNPFFSKQNSNGHIPGEIDPAKSSSGINPPIIAWTVERMARFKPDHKVLREVYQSLAQFHRFLRKDRLSDGMYYWNDFGESAMEDSPRFYIRKKDSRVSKVYRFLPIDLNSQVVLELRSLAALAHLIGKNPDAEAYTKEANSLSAKINQSMWNEQDGLYYDVYEKNQVKIPTIASFYPLTAGIPSQKQADAMISALTNNNLFWTSMPFPSVAKNNPRFKLTSWQGPTWLSASYMVINGLDLYGRKDIAAEAARNIVKNVFGTWSKTGTFFEFYNPFTGDTKDLSRNAGFPSNVLVGSEPLRDFAGSTAIVDNLLVENVLGIKWKNSKLTFEPALPLEWLGHSIKYKSPFMEVDCSMTLFEADKVRVKLGNSADEIIVPNIITKK